MTARPPYDRTALRPAWDELPAAVRHRVTELAGAQVIGAEVAGGGFTRGFAGLLRLAGGGSVFVKAASPQLPVAPDSYRAEASVLSNLPAGVPAPRLRFTDEVGGWVLLGIEAVDGGRMPGGVLRHRRPVLARASPRAVSHMTHERAPADDVCRGRLV